MLFAAVTSNCLIVKRKVFDLGPRVTTLVFIKIGSVVKSRKEEFLLHFQPSILNF